MFSKFKDLLFTFIPNETLIFDALVCQSQAPYAGLFIFMMREIRVYMGRRMIKMMKFKGIAGLLAMMAFSAVPALAGQKLIVEKNHTLRVALSGPAGSVIVGNPDIADVTVIDSRTVYVVGKGFGTSAVTITDRMGRSLFDGEIMVASGTQGGVTVYKGLTPSTMVCSNVCVADPSAANSNNPAISPVSSAGTSAVAAAQAAAGMGNVFQPK